MSLPLLAAVFLAAPVDPADALAARIDRHLAADWASRGITPAPPADDAEFVRRVYLDLVGRIPRVAEARAFLDDPDPHKRNVLIDRLLATPGHAAHLAAVTRIAWLPQSATNPQYVGGGVQLEGWLRGHFRRNTPADEVVRALLTPKLQVFVRGDNPRTVQPDTASPDAFAVVGFFQANEGRAENLAAAVSRVFLGVKLECAQCHDHPFAAHTRAQFWEFAAFFAEFGNAPPNPATPGPPTLTIPNTDRTVAAKFFDGTDPAWRANRGPREELAAWLTGPANRYFARNLANRTWAHLFGLGLLDPVDEPADNNPPSHPELLDDLAAALADAKFDQRFLLRAVARSQAYQRTSRLTHPTQEDARRFARVSLKGLTPAQLFDSLVAATGFREQPGLRQQFAGFGGGPGNPRGAVANRFASTEKPTETQTSILQALMLMNGGFVADQTSLDKGETLVAVQDAPFWDTPKRVEALFLAALTRRPTAEEAERFGSYIDRGGPTGDKAKALADVFWVLLNSTEFRFNH